MRSEDRVLVITSAGCNALDYALLGAQVVAVDANPRQNHLLELKRAGIRALDCERLLRAVRPGRHVRVAGHLRGPARASCRTTPAPSGTARSGSSIPAKAGGSFYFRGSSGLVARGLRFHIDHVARVAPALGPGPVRVEPGRAAGALPARAAPDAAGRASARGVSAPRRDDPARRPGSPARDGGEPPRAASRASCAAASTT